MPALCLCYEVHEPYRLCRYTVFDMGQNSLYEDDDHNCDALLLTARTCYLPMNDLLLKLIRRHGKAFKVAFSISGTALDQFEQYAPEVVESFQALADTGNVEFVAETAPHSLAFLYSRDEFDIQVREQCERIKRLFGKKPTTFRNTEFVYNNDLPVALEKLGFKAVLAEGADHVLGWRSPNYVYRPISTPRMRLLLRNSSLSTDIGLRFNDQGWDQWPLTAEKYASWCHSFAASSEIINIFNDYHSFGLRNPRESGIFDFMEALPAALLAHKDFHFVTPAEAARKIDAVGEVDVPEFMSWDDEGRDLTAWLGNDMQKDAIVHSISSVMLDPTHTNHAIRINDITQVTVNGQDLGLGGYLDIGLIDTMEDLVVNFIGAVVFSVFGFLYVKNRGKKDSIISRFVPRRKSADRDYLRLVIDGGSRESHTNMRDTVIEQTFDCPDKLDA